MFNVRTILYPTDFSSFSTQAYFHAVGLAENYRAKLTVIYVFRPRDPSRSAMERAYWLEQLETIRPTNAKIPVTHVLLEGDAATEIVRFAADTKTDVIVMGTHGRTGAERELMGSTAEHVMRDAPCSVMVVKMPKGTPPAARPHVELIAQQA
ncbi:universal stress protein [Limnoglobus roseus]|uniref:Universal stress protein n=1 Tax=Limnoglobus roseus TaxID=2598579 RepID=A0A5C1A7E2_9BACT|nr:universal stress protein [Limnoglobus roseus]QEL14375.1 universal stress protein [Limnoglobus roseus]